MNSLPTLHKDEESLYIDPKIIDLRYTGGGINDPSYNSGAAQASDQSIDLEQHAVSHHEVQEERGRRSIEEDIEQIANTQQLRASWQSSLRPEATPFVPKGGRPTLAVDTASRKGSSRGCSKSNTPRTPRIKLSHPDDDPLKAWGGIGQHDQQKARPRRRSSPAPSTPFSSSQRQPSRTRWSVVAGRLDSERLSPATNKAAASWVSQHSYHVGDRIFGSHTPRVYSTDPVPASPYSLGTSSTPSQSSGGFYCTFTGCDESFKAWDTPSQLNHHHRKHVPEEQRPHGCPYCEKRFSYPKDVRRHLKTKTHTRTHETCPVCHDSISRKDNLNRHMASQHNTSSIPGSASTSQNTASSPSVSSSTSFAQSVFNETMPSTPQTLGPCIQKSSFLTYPTLPSFGNLDDFDSSCDTASQLSAQSMQKSYSN